MNRTILCLLVLLLFGPTGVPAQDDVPEVVRVRLEEAERFRRSGDLEQAVERAEEARELGPDVVRVYLLLGALHHAQGDLEKSFEAFESGLERNADDRDLLYNAAVVALRLERLEKAEEFTARALERHRGDIDLLSLRSAALARLDRLPEALEVLEQAWKKDRRNAQILFRLGNLQNELGQVDEAIDSYRKAIDQEPGMLRAHYNLGAVLFAQNDFDAALTAYQVALAPLREARGRGETIEPVHAPAFANLGAIHLRREEWAEAVDAYDAALALDLESVGVERGRGFALFQLERYDDALAAYDRALQTESATPEIEFQLGLIHQRRGEATEAVARLESALPGLTGPELERAWRALAESRETLGRADAAQAWREVLRGAPEDGMAHLHLGRLLRRAGQGDEARQSLERATELLPGHLGVSIELAALAQSEGRRDEERRLYQQVLGTSAGAGLWPVRLRLALLQLGAGETQAAGEELEQLASRFGKEGGPSGDEASWVEALRGLVALAQGDAAAAEARLAPLATAADTPASQALAVLAASGGDWQEAARRLGSGSSQASVFEQANRGQVLWARGELDTAEPLLRAAAQELADWPSLAIALGDIARRRGDTRAALVELERGVELCATSATQRPSVPPTPEGVFVTLLGGDPAAEQALCTWARGVLARLLLDVARTDLASAVARGGSSARAVRQSAERALGLGLPSDLTGAARYILGTAALAAGDEARARSELQAALEGGLSPELEASAETNLAVALAGSGAQDRAIELLRRRASTVKEAGLDLAILLDAEGGRGEEALALYEAYLNQGGPRRAEVEARAERLRRIYR